MAGGGGSAGKIEDHEQLILVLVVVLALGWVAAHWDTVWPKARSWLLVHAHPLMTAVGVGGKASPIRLGAIAVGAVLLALAAGYGWWQQQQSSVLAEHK